MRLVQQKAFRAYLEAKKQAYQMLYANASTEETKNKYRSLYAVLINICKAFDDESELEKYCKIWEVV